MGYTVIEAGTRRQSTFSNRDKHYTALQGASASIGITFHGEVCPALACAVIERTARQRRPYRTA
jgi:hypothetical protein